MSAALHTAKQSPATEAEKPALRLVTDKPAPKRKAKKKRKKTEWVSVNIGPMPVRSTKQNPGRRDYYPEVAEWVLDFTDPQKPYTFRFMDDDRPVFTLQVSEAYTEQVASRIAWLLLYAPELWRELQEVGTHMVHHCSDVRRFANVSELLWQAAGRNPYRPAEKPTDDRDGMFRAINLGPRATDAERQAVMERAKHAHDDDIVA